MNRLFEIVAQQANAATVADPDCCTKFGDSLRVNLVLVSVEGGKRAAVQTAGRISKMIFESLVRNAIFLNDVVDRQGKTNAVVCGLGFSSRRGEVGHFLSPFCFDGILA